jgi:hypothetical protein
MEIYKHLFNLKNYQLGYGYKYVILIVEDEYDDEMYLMLCFLDISQNLKLNVK